MNAAIETSLSAIARHDRALNAFTAVTAESARLEAARLSAEGPLAGLPFAVKNLFDIAGVTTLAGSIIDADRPAAIRDAFVVERLRRAGAVLVGATNMDEYAYGFTTENAHYGATRNPHDRERVAGGSSGGSAAAVAAGLVPISLGSDTNGSVRVPAAFCGIYGLKPTFGRLSRRGVRPFVHSLDHVGLFARDLGLLAAAYDAMQGFDAEDPACVDRPVELATPEIAKRLRGLRVGRLRGWFDQAADPSVISGMERVSSALGALDTELAGAEAARSAAFCITGAEGGSLHLEALRRRPGDFDPATRDRLIAGALLPAAIIARAQRVRRKVLEQALALFQRFDVLIAPATPFTAPRIGQATIELNGQAVSTRANAGIYTQPISCLGLPVVAVPIVQPGRLPVGVQLIGPPWSEALLLRLAHRLEQNGVGGPGPIPNMEA